MSKPYNGIEVVVVAHERVEGTELHPSDTQFLRRVQMEAAHIGAHKRNPEQTERYDRYK